MTTKTQTTLLTIGTLLGLALLITFILLLTQHPQTHTGIPVALTITILLTSGCIAGLIIKRME